jgi:hypothetical protein
VIKYSPLYRYSPENDHGRKPWETATTPVMIRHVSRYRIANHRYCTRFMLRRGKRREDRRGFHTGQHSQARSPCTSCSCQHLKRKTREAGLPRRRLPTTLNEAPVGVRDQKRIGEAQFIPKVFPVLALNVSARASRLPPHSTNCGRTIAVGCSRAPARWSNMPAAFVGAVPGWKPSVEQRPTTHMQIDA